jgi:hypothetical protein
MFAVITAWLSNGWSKLLPWIAGIGGAAIAFFAIKQSGESQAYAKVAQQQLEKANEELKVSQSVSSMSDQSVADKLRSFYRD